MKRMIVIGMLATVLAVTFVASHESFGFDYKILYPGNWGKTVESGGIATPVGGVPYDTNPQQGESYTGGFTVGKNLARGEIAALRPGQWIEVWCDSNSAEHRFTLKSITDDDKACFDHSPVSLGAGPTILKPPGWSDDKALEPEPEKPVCLGPADKITSMYGCDFTLEVLKAFNPMKDDKPNPAGGYALITVPAIPLKPSATGSSQKSEGQSGKGVGEQTGQPGNGVKYIAVDPSGYNQQDVDRRAREGK